jgi:release factor glutamine methyltransferase
MTDAFPKQGTWAELQRDVEARVALTEARWIVETVSGLRGAELIAGRHETATVGGLARAHDMVERRVAGEPLQYVLGEWAFRGIDVFVDPRVLIPRPETEVTAQVAIDAVSELGARRGRSNPWAGAQAAFTVVDLGTGSGAIAIALAAELPDAEVWATDVSAEALAVAHANVAGAGSVATRIRLAHGDWFSALPDYLRGGVRVAVANPPYLAASEVDDLPTEVADHEPRVALVSGPTGLEAIERIVGEAPEWLEADGVLVVEIAPHQSGPAIGIARRAGFADTRVERDLTARDRVLVARLSEN